MGGEVLSSREKLDQMLRDKVITPADHRRLAEAMGEREGLETGRLRKSFTGGQIGGLCAGCARYFGVDVLVVRGILILASAVVLGILTIPLYVLGCLCVPWDDPEKARALRETGHPRLFTAAVGCLFLVVPGVYSLLVIPTLTEFYARMGHAVFSVGNQATWAGRAFDCASGYRECLTELVYGQFEHKAFILAFILLFTLLVLLVGSIYGILCTERRRGQYASAVIWLGVAWVLFLVTGTLYPLIQ